ncbi:MAG: translation elongation factor Ts [Gemmatimonadaceae bacterium]|jgi:elongation factor Ts|nr:translation elongation factor Ts [Gemmatimonadaceae bacterium]MCU0626727.1 translation elongation factor Ts [Gemmatimonadaceae bacterium]
MTTMSFTAKDVQELRQRTGAGMMDCKKALTETNGDLEAAVEYLRKKGIAKMEKRGDRATSEGVIGTLVTADGRHGVLVEVNCETDFVARNDAFGAIVTLVLQQAASTDVADAEALLASTVAAQGATLDDVLKAESAKLGEVVNVRRFARFKPAAGAVGSYQHHNSKVGVLVEATLGDASLAAGEPVQQMLRAIAEHAAAMNPLSLDEAGIPADVVEKEKRIAEDQARQSGKPEAMIAKIAEGKLKAFFKDNSLLHQPWVREPKKTITDLVAETAKAAGTTITVTRFTRFALGDA